MPINSIFMIFIDKELIKKIKFKYRIGSRDSSDERVVLLPVIFYNGRLVTFLF